MNKTLLLDALETFIEKVNPQYLKYHKIADKAEPVIRQAFLKAIAALQGSIVLSEVEKAISKGDLKAAENAINWGILEKQTGKIGATLSKVFIASASEAILDLRVMNGVKIGTSFTIRNIKAEQWAAKNVANLLKPIIYEETKEAVREIITTALKEGGHPYQTAKLIKQHIGLTKGQAIAVQNKRQALIDSGTKLEQVEKLVGRYSKQLLRYRSENIARTETINAASQGQLEVWNEAIEEGLLPETAQKKWIVTPDDITCETICLPMEGQIVDIDEPFTTGIGDEVMSPTAHPSCRCAFGLVFDIKKHLPGGHDQLSHGSGGETENAKTLESLNDKLSKDEKFKSIGAVTVEAWRVGEIKDSQNRGIFFGGTQQDVAPYKTLHPNQVEKKVEITTKNTLLTRHQSHVSEYLTGKTYQELHYAGGGGTKGQVYADRKIMIGAKKNDYDSIIYLSPAAPANKEIAVLDTKTVEIRSSKGFRYVIDK